MHIILHFHSKPGYSDHFSLELGPHQQTCDGEVVLIVQFLNSTFEMYIFQITALRLLYESSIKTGICLHKHAVLVISHFIKKN